MISSSHAPSSEAPRRQKPLLLFGVALVVAHMALLAGSGDLDMTEGHGPSFPTHPTAPIGTI